MKVKSKVLFLQEDKEYNLEDDLLLDLTKHHIYQGKIKFVGIFFSNQTNTSIICYPKYMDNIDEKNFLEQDKLVKETRNYMQHMNLVCKVIEKCKLKSNMNIQYDFSPFDQKKDTKKIGLFSIAKFILQDYIENGIYEMKSNIFSKNAKGPISWTKTINRIIPVISNNEVYYFDTLNNKQIIDKDRIITKIHMYVLSESAKLVKDVLGFSQINLPNMSEINFYKEDRKKIKVIIQSYMNQVFSNREISLLKALSAWFDDSKNYIPKVGTNSFNLIWECVCKTVFGHNQDIEKMMPSPHLYLYDKARFIHEEVKASKLIPDVLRVSENNKILYILDAKYYKPVINNNTYKDAPGASDVSKQFSYETQLMKLKKENMNSMFGEYKSYNAFLIPHFYKDLPQNIYEKLGYASMLQSYNISEKEIQENDKIYYYQINPTHFFERFLSLDSKFTDDEMNEFIL